MKNEAGISTLEILIAMAIIVLSLSAVILVLFGGQSLSVNTQTTREALSKAQIMMESIRAESLQDPNLITSCDDSTAIKCFGAIDPFYTRKIIVTTIDSEANTKRVTTEVDWNEGGLRNLKVELSTIVNDLETLTSNTCSQTLTGDWINPQTTSFEFGKDLLADPLSAYQITDMITISQKLYVTVNNTHPNNNSSLFIFDITNPTAPTLITSLDNDPTVSAGLNAVAVSGKYAYAASARSIDFSRPCPGGNCGQLQIFDISVTPPVLVASLRVPGVTGISGQAIGSSIFYRSGIVYLGLAKTASGPEFNIFDVGGGGSPGASPIHPIYLGGLAVGNAVNAIRVSGKNVFIATPNTENVMTLDVSDLTAPIRVGGFTPTGGANGLSLALHNDQIYLGRAFGNNEFYILNATDPTNLTLAGNKDIGTGNQTSIHGIIVRDHLAFFITEQQFQIWDVQNPSGITIFTSPLDLPLASSGIAISCSGNYLYLGSVPASEKGILSIVTSGP